MSFCVLLLFLLHHVQRQMSFGVLLLFLLLPHDVQSHVHQPIAQTPITQRKLLTQRRRLDPTCQGTNPHTSPANCAQPNTYTRIDKFVPTCSKKSPGDTSCPTGYAQSGHTEKCAEDCSSGWSWLVGCKDIKRTTECVQTCPNAYSGTCDACNDGYQSNKANTNCDVCNAGHYCQNGERTACPPGTYSTQTGQTSATACASCGSADRHCTAGSSEHRGKVTPSGSFSTGCVLELNQVNVDCTGQSQCPTGSYCWGGNEYKWYIGFFFLSSFWCFDL